MARLRASWRTSLPVVQQPRNPQSESIARTPYYLALTSVREADVEGVLDAQDERDVPLRKRRHPGRADELPISHQSDDGGLGRPRQRRRKSGTEGRSAEPWWRSRLGRERPTSPEWQCHCE